jgi:hypothetical protein
VNRVLWTAIALAAAATPLSGQLRDTGFEIYGFAMTDVGFDFGQIHPDWFDVIRTTKLPSFEDEFGPDGRTFFSVRQTRFGVRSTTPTSEGDLKIVFEWELFGTGVDAGQTTLRLRHAYGELGQFGAGQYWSPFMDIDVFPNTIEYWGPAGMAFFRNVQVRWMPVQGDSRVTVALERPGASGDQGIYADRIELEDIRPHFPAPDLSAEGRWADDWGYVELAGLLRWIEWEDFVNDAFDFDGDAVGWGLNLSSNINAGSRSIVRLQALYGEGIENYMNDAPVDIGVEVNPGSTVAPLKGEAIPIVGVVAFLDHNWNDQSSSSIGYSGVFTDPSSQMLPSSFQNGHYALLNYLYKPVPDFMLGGELQWGMRENFTDDFTSDTFRIQLSFKYNFSETFGGS